MSLHRSLKTKPGALDQHRNVLTRAERITMLQSRDAFDPLKNAALGLPKVASRKASTGKKKKAKEGEEGAVAEGAAPAAATPAAAAAKPAAKAPAKPAGKGK
jgi:small basic protein (TIGR04137 family)